jgi:transposase
MQNRGIGATTALAIVATVGYAREFKNGRRFAAWIGLVPGQYSTGGRSVNVGLNLTHFSSESSVGF